MDAVHCQQNLHGHQFITIRGFEARNTVNAS
jgi:hypothetical protein